MSYQIATQLVRPLGGLLMRINAARQVEDALQWRRNGGEQPDDEHGGQRPKLNEPAQEWARLQPEREAGLVGAHW